MASAPPTEVIANPANNVFYKTSFATLIENCCLRHDETVVAFLLGLTKLTNDDTITMLDSEVIREALVLFGLQGYDYLHNYSWNSFTDKADLIYAQHQKPALDSKTDS